ncbi:MAG: hypothetical protein MK010_05670, partial [Erythrobacter sp.]|nr:hypothetical protein [Erythrobacter sp.]
MDIRAAEISKVIKDQIANFGTEAEVSEANIIGQEIARINLRMNRAGPGSSDRASLLDQRDLMLEKLAGLASIKTSFAPDGTVAVSLGSPEVS